jgi:DNA replication protein DnaC
MDNSLLGFFLISFMGGIASTLFHEIFPKLWSIVLVPFHRYSVYLYKISDKETCKLLISQFSKKNKNKPDDNTDHVEEISTNVAKNDNVIAFNNNEKPSGIVYNWKRKYIAWIEYQSSYNDEKVTIWLMSSSTEYKKLSQNIQETQTHIDESGERKEKPKTSIKLYYRRGHYFYLSYQTRDLSFYEDKYQARPKQVEIIDQIITIYKEKNRCVVYLYGAMGSGKSYISFLLAKELKAHLCNSFNPTEPGDTLSNLYNEVLPDKDKPLIVVLDEFDVILINIHAQKIGQHKNIPVSVYNKQTWNRFMDDINLGIMYPNLILVMTSNVTPKVINELDPSYIRSGRVDLKLSLD